MNDTIIQAGNLCMQSGKKFLLRNINWTVKAGEHWLVFGMNGSGKTTLLSAVAGFKCPTKGTLEVLGHTYNNENIFALRKKVGWVSSSFFECIYRRSLRWKLCCRGFPAHWVSGTALPTAMCARLRHCCGNCICRIKSTRHSI